MSRPSFVFSSALSMLQGWHKDTKMSRIEREKTKTGILKTGETGGALILKVSDRYEEIDDFLCGSFSAFFQPFFSA